MMRGVNVGGQGKLPMAEFRALLGALGFGDVSTYIQSGNAVFTAQGTANDIATQISAQVERQFGFFRPCVVMPAQDLDRAIARCPFAPAADDPTMVHLIFLKDVQAFDAKAFEACCTADETGLLDGSVFYLYTPNGYGRSKAAAKLDGVLKARVLTARNLKSCHKIAALARG
jgi:uncharacterized protein (DUF1697 family)